MKKLKCSFRISIIDQCNFKCLYCAHDSNMENYCPSTLRNNVLKKEQFLNIIDKILNQYEFSKIVITGGEPLLSKNLVDILKQLKKYNNKIELDTNGSMFDINRHKEIFSYIDEIKVSLDTLDNKMFNLLTNNKNEFAMSNIKNLILESKRANIPVTINCVLTKINYNSINEIVDYSIKNKLNVSILDLYYTDETKKFWKTNFIDIEKIKDELQKKFKNIYDNDTYGCDFKYIYYNEKNYIRFKSSSNYTMRDCLCEKCENYCQEGIFSLRLSCQGWLTACQNNEKYGILLPNEIDKITTIIQRIENAKPDIDSFEKMIYEYHL